MKTLLLLRHAKSSWKDEGLDDHQRGLNKRGKRDAPRMGQLLRELDLVPDFVVTSSAKRARKTAEQVADAAGFCVETRITGDLYEASWEKILGVISQISDDFGRALLVGHNPGLEEFFEHFSGKYTPLPTAALVQLTIPITHWKKFSPKTAVKIVQLWQPRELS